MTDTDQCCKCSDIRLKKEFLKYLIKMKRKNIVHNTLHTIINYYENILTVIIFGMITVEV